MQNFEFVKILRDTISHRRNPLSEDLSLPESEQDLLYENAAIVFVCSEYAGLLMRISRKLHRRVFVKQRIAFINDSSFLRDENPMSTPAERFSKDFRPENLMFALSSDKVLRCISVAFQENNPGFRV